MPRELKIGDRVSVNGFTMDGTYCDGWKASFEGRNGALIYVQLDGRIAHESVHPKQVRRLLPRRRRLYAVVPSWLTSGVTAYYSKEQAYKVQIDTDPNGTVQEFIQCRGRK